MNNIDTTHHSFLPGELVTLSPLQEIHIENYLSSFSSTVMAALHVSTLQAERDYLQSCLQEMHEEKTFFYLIHHAGDQKLIGAIAIRDPQKYPGQLYSWLNENYWGGGRYQEALALITQFYFARTQALFITAQVDITNTRSHRALKKYGFADSGISQGPYGKQFELILRNKTRVLPGDKV